MSAGRRSSPQAAAPGPLVTTLRERVRREMATGMLLAAEEVFAESGLAKAHVEDIARRAGVSVGTLYNYYEDRDGLLAAVLASRRDELLGELDQAVARTAESPVRAAMVELAPNLPPVRRPASDLHPDPDRGGARPAEGVLPDVRDHPREVLAVAARRVRQGDRARRRPRDALPARRRPGFVDRRRDAPRRRASVLPPRQAVPRRRRRPRHRRLLRRGGGLT